MRIDRTKQASLSADAPDDKNEHAFEAMEFSLPPAFTTLLGHGEALRRGS